MHADYNPQFITESQGRRDWVGAPVKEFFGTFQQGRNSTGKSKETNQRASYARWSLPASTVNEIIHFLIVSDITEKDDSILNRGAPGPSTDRQIPGNLYRLPPALIGTA